MAVRGTAASRLLRQDLLPEQGCLSFPALKRVPPVQPGLSATAHSVFP